MATTIIEDLYRQTYADRIVTPDESAELVATLEELQRVRSSSTSSSSIIPQPALTPDKLVWLRAAAFRIACEYLVGDDDGDDDDPRGEENVRLLKAVNAVVHALETTCLLPTLDEEGGGEEFSKEAAEELLVSLYENGEDDEDNGEDDDDVVVVTGNEANALRTFLTDDATRPPLSALVWLRSAAFRIGSRYLDNEKEKNVALLRSINVVVHIVEDTCMKPKPLTLDLPPSHAPDADTDFTTAAQTLWNLDSNRLVPIVDYDMNVQNSKHPYHDKGVDAAREPLFRRVDRRIFEQRPTYRTFRRLLDNYSACTGDEEEVTSAERRENRAFLDAVMETAPMKYCHAYCLAKEGVEYRGRPIPEDEVGFKQVLDSIWFQLYSRSGGGRRRKMDSSGFEHVFVGEVKNGKVSGFHNWIMFHLEERRGNVDYRGYIKPRGSRNNNMAETDDDDRILTLQFSWNGVEKFVGTSFIGVSPEFELALYTMAFLAGGDDDDDGNNVITLETGGGEAFDLNVKAHKYDRGTKVGSCYVEALAHYE